MKILFITRLFYPHIGGVERHVVEVSKFLRKKGNSITVLTEKYDKSLEDNEDIDGVKVVRYYYPHIKLLGLIFVWWQILIRRKLIEEADMVHIHDVFIWYLPFRFLYPKKKVIITFHGLEWDNPFSKLSILQKRLNANLSNGTVGVGKYLEKYTSIKFDLVIYGAISPNRFTHRKVKGSIVYVGRLEENTGLGKFLEWIKKNPKYTVEFCGDGPLRKRCEKIGRVYGFIANPSPFLEKAEYCVPGGYLGAMEALNVGCKLKLFSHDKLREDVWRMTPFVEKNAKAWVRTQTWDKLADEYLNLYNHI